jgi:hypothetical protein
MVGALAFAAGFEASFAALLAVAVAFESTSDDCDWIREQPAIKAAEIQNGTSFFISKLLLQIII